MPIYIIHFLGYKERGTKDKCTRKSKKYIQSFKISSLKHSNLLCFINAAVPTHPAKRVFIVIKKLVIIFIMILSKLFIAGIIMTMMNLTEKEREACIEY